MPPRALRELRDLTRYRGKLLGNGAAERNRIQKILEDANIKLGSVLSDVFGASGQRILHALVTERQVDIDQVARLAHWKLEPKMALIKRALDGHLTDHHCFVIQVSLDHMTYLEQQIVRLDARIGQSLAHYQQAYDLLQTIPGLKEHSAAAVLAEIGPDMAHFEDTDHLASWTGLCPGNNETAGKHSVARRARAINSCAPPSSIAPGARPGRSIRSFGPRTIGSRPDADPSAPSSPSRTSS